MPIKIIVSPPESLIDHIKAGWKIKEKEYIGQAEIKHQDGHMIMVSQMRYTLEKK